MLKKGPDPEDSGLCFILHVDQNNMVTVSEFPNQPNSLGPIIMYSSGLPTPFISQWTRSNECVNIYDPSTKEFKLRYGYYQGISALRVIEEIIKKN